MNTMTTSIVAAIAARDAFAAKIRSISTVIDNLYVEGAAFDHMIDQDSNTVAVSVSAAYVGHWSLGWDSLTSARVARVSAAMAAAGLRHHDTGHAPGGVRLIFRA